MESNHASSAPSGSKDTYKGLKQAVAVVLEDYLGWSSKDTYKGLKPSQRKEMAKK